MNGYTPKVGDKVRATLARRLVQVAYVAALMSGLAWAFSLCEVPHC